MKIVLILLITFGSSVTIADGQFGVFDFQVRRFVYEAKLQGVKVNTQRLRIEFMPGLPHRWLAACFNMGSYYPYIGVDRYVWERSGSLRKEYTIFHEMGHCILNRNHDTRLKDGYHPISIMYPDDRVIDNSQYYLEYRAEYMHELFHPNK